MRVVVCQTTRNLSRLGPGTILQKCLPCTHDTSGAGRQGNLIDRAFSLPKCVRLARMCRLSRRFLRKLRGAMPEETEKKLKEMCLREHLSYKKDNSSIFDRHVA